MIKLSKEFEVTESERQVLQTLEVQGGETYPSKVAKILDKSRQTVTEQIQNLEEKDLISLEAESNINIYRINRNGLLYLRQLEYSDKEIPKVRHHKIAIAFELVEGHEDLDSGETLGTVELNNWIKFTGNTQIEGTHRIIEANYEINPTSLVIKLPEILGPCTCQGVGLVTLEAYQQAIKVKDQLLRKHSDLKVGRAEPEFTEHHYALEHHPMARLLDYLDLDKFLKSNDDNKLVLDYSKGFEELEAEGQNSREYIENIIDSFNFMAEKSLRERFKEL